MLGCRERAKRWVRAAGRTSTWMRQPSVERRLAKNPRGAGCEDVASSCENWTKTSVKSLSTLIYVQQNEYPVYNHISSEENILFWTEFICKTSRYNYSHLKRIWLCGGNVLTRPLGRAHFPRYVPCTMMLMWCRRGATTAHPLVPMSIKVMTYLFSMHAVYFSHSANLKTCMEPFQETQC